MHCIIIIIIMLLLARRAHGLPLAIETLTLPAPPSCAPYPYSPTGLACRTALRIISVYVCSLCSPMGPCTRRRYRPFCSHDPPRVLCLLLVPCSSPPPSHRVSHLQTMIVVAMATSSSASQSYHIDLDVVVPATSAHRPVLCRHGLCANIISKNSSTSSIPGSMARHSG